MSSLSRKERELVALGAAIGAHCVSCIEYHIPEGRTAGLSDAQILEAVRVAEKVRRVAGAKVLGTARAHLENSERTNEEKSHEFACPGDPTQSPHLSATNAGTCSGGPAPHRERKAADESASVQEDNRRNQSQGADPAGVTEENKRSKDSFPFDLPQNMQQMMEQCCPEKAERVSSVMERFSADCCGSMPNSGKGKRQKPSE